MAVKDKLQSKPNAKTEGKAANGKPPKPAAIRRQSIEVPLKDPPPNSNTDALSINFMTTIDQAAGLRRLRSALTEQGATVKTRDGRSMVVQSPADVVRWLLERL